jgi:hypothetical protein
MYVKAVESILVRRARGRPRKPVEDKFLKFLNGVAGASGFMDIVTHSGLPKSTVWRYLHGYSEMVTRTNGKYSLTESGLSTFRSLYGKELTRKMQEHLMSSISVEDVMQYTTYKLRVSESREYLKEHKDIIDKYPKLRLYKHPVIRAYLVRRLLEGDLCPDCLLLVIRDKDGTKVCPKCGRELPEEGLVGY